MATPVEATVDRVRWLIRTTAFHDATFDACLEALGGTGGVLAPYARSDRLSLLRVLARGRDLRARVGSRAPTLDRLRRLAESSTDGFTVTVWFQPRGTSLWSDHPDIAEVAITVWPGQQRPGHVEVTGFASPADAEATGAVFEALVARWGAEFGGAWFGMEPCGPFGVPYLEPAIGRDEVVVDTLGPTWLTILRPEVAHRLDDGWRRANGLEVAVTPVDGPGGRHEIWRLGEMPRNLEQEQAERWVAALGCSMPPTEFPR